MSGDQEKTATSQISCQSAPTLKVTPMRTPDLLRLFIFPVWQSLNVNQSWSSPRPAHQDSPDWLQTHQATCPQPGPLMCSGLEKEKINSVRVKNTPSTPTLTTCYLTWVKQLHPAAVWLVHCDWTTVQTACTIGWNVVFCLISGSPDQ